VMYYYYLPENGETVENVRSIMMFATYSIENVAKQAADREYYQGKAWKKQKNMTFVILNKDKQVMGKAVMTIEMIPHFYMTEMEIPEQEKRRCQNP